MISDLRIARASLTCCSSQRTVETPLITLVASDGVGDPDRTKSLPGCQFAVDVPLTTLVASDWVDETDEGARLPPSCQLAVDVPLTTLVPTDDTEPDRRLAQLTSVTPETTLLLVFEEVSSK